MTASALLIEFNQRNVAIERVTDLNHWILLGRSHIPNGHSLTLKQVSVCLETFSPRVHILNFCPNCYQHLFILLDLKTICAAIFSTFIVSQGIFGIRPCF